MIRNRASLRRAVFNQPRIRRINRNSSILKHKRRDPHVPNLLAVVKNRTIVPQPCKSTHILNILADINVSELPTAYT